ncbi:MAG: Crp/Fnr family transcriptional regulator [Firmicutes bacterium]|nr:Crp/Fnr family transcriptional regulator [Bacillota bacterium]
MGNFKKISNSQELVNDISKCANAFIGNYKQGAKVTEFGTNNKVVGIVIRGEIDVIREDELGNRTILEKLLPNSIFAEQLTYYGNDFTYAISSIDSSIIILTYDYIIKSCARNCEHHQKLVSRISELLIERSTLLSKRVDILSRKTTRDKIIAYLKTLSVSETNKVHIPYSYSNLAEYLCIDRANLMRELKKMENDKLIKRVKQDMILFFLIT